MTQSCPTSWRHWIDDEIKMVMSCKDKTMTKFTGQSWSCDKLQVVIDASLEF